MLISHHSKGHHHVHDNAFRDGGIDIQGDSDGGPSAIVEGNTFTRAPVNAIKVSGAAEVTVQRNTFSNNGSGIQVWDADITIRDNELVDNDYGIVLTSSDSLVERNTVRGGDYGILVVAHAAPAAPTIASNSIDGANKRGITAGPGTMPTISGNHVCGSEENLRLDSAARPDVADDNDICPDGPAAPG